MADVGSANINITADDSQAQSTIGGFMGSLKRIGGIASGVMGGLALFETAKNTFGGLWNATINANAGMESYRNTLATVLKSWEKADQTLAWVETFAAKTPFEIPELVEATTRLETYGITAKDTLGTIGDMASVMGKPLMQAVEAVADSQTGELERLKEFGITKQMLIDKALQLGKGEIVNAKGQITNQKAMNEALFAIMRERYSGGMELQSQTFNGMISNVKDSMGQIAREMSRPVFDGLKKGLAGVVPVLGAFTAYVKGDIGAAMEQMEAAVGPEMADRIWLAMDIVNSIIAESKEFIRDLQPAVQNLIDTFKNVAPVLAPVGLAMEQAFYKLTDWLPPILEDITAILEAFTGWEGFIPTIAGVAASMGTYQGIVAAVTKVQAAYTAVVNFSTTAMNLYRVAMMTATLHGGGLRGAMMGLMAVFRALNLTMLANPIGLTIAALVGLGVALYTAYQKSETFRNAVDKAWQGIKDGFNATINWFTTTLPAWASNVAAGFGRMKDQVIARIQELISSGVAKWNSFKASVLAVVSSWVASALNLFNSMKSRATSVISTLVSGAVNLFNALRARIMAILQPFITFFIASWNNLKLMVLSIVTGLASLLVGDFEGIRLAITGIQEALKRQLIAIWNLLKATIIRIALDIWNRVVANFNLMKNAVINTNKALINGAIDLFNRLLSSGKQAFESLKQGAINSAKALYNGTIATFKSLVAGGINAWESLKNGAINAVKALYNGAINLFNRLKSGSVNSANDAKNGIINGFNTAKNEAITAIRNLYNGVVDWLNQVPSKVTEMKNNMISILQDIDLRQMGKDAIQGFINGIGDMISSVRTKVGSVVDTLKEKLRGDLEMNSPSKLLQTYGNWTFEGFINGADEMLGGIRNVAAKAASAIQPDVDQVAPQSSLMNALGNIGNSFMNGFAGNQAAAAGSNTPYILQVNLNGRVIAEETYQDIQDLQNRATSRVRRARGEVV